jgi:glycosyltransferase 2 family protein
MNRTALVTALKLAIAIAIVWVLIATDRLSLTPVRQLFGSPMTCIALVLLQLAITLLGVVRWWLILRAIEGRARSLGSLLAYTWVGLFAGCVLPSAVATDFVRYRYLRAGEVVSTPLVTSILVDRICGITSLGLLALVFSPRMFAHVASGTRAWLIAAGITLLIVIALVLARSSATARTQLERTRTALRSVLADKTTSLIAVALGFLAHALKCVSLYLIVCEVAPGAVSLGVFFSFAPVGFVVEALPLTPGGLGTAHLLFAYLFHLVGVEGGASLFNAYFLVRMFVNLGGGVVWLFTPSR